MFKSLVILLCAVGAISAVGSSEEHPEVAAPTGRVRGSIFNSRNGRKIYAFRAVRYAEPPVGQQRFQVAVPAADWDDVFDATQEGPACPNIGKLPVSEDCLRLNVYTTQLPGKNESVNKPVLVFFHPGGFYSFSAQSSNFGPEYIMDQDIVLVTVNYRLATLGFISTGDSLAPGNIAFKDQVVALRWIKRNIAAFGGDPNSVTISGYSAGSMSVFLHMVSPMSRNLFHRVIAMSAGIPAMEPLPTHQKHLAKKQAELLGCPTDTTGSMLICLNSKPVENFTNTITQFFEYYGDPILVWSPVVEPEVHGVERFLPDQPIDLIRQGRFYNVPVIAGITKDEFGGVLTGFISHYEKGNDSLYRALNEDGERLMPISFLYERGTPRSRYITEELKKYYFHGKPVGPDNNRGIADIYADSVINAQVHRTSKLIAENSRKPLYFYMFTYQGRNSFAKWNNGTPYGVAHHDDLQYLFYMKNYFPYLEKSDPENAMVDRYTAIVAEFCKTGEPIPKNNEAFRNVVWERYVSEKDNYLDINLHPTMKNGIYPERMQVWERLFPLKPITKHPTKH